MSDKPYCRICRHFQWTSFGGLCRHPDAVGFDRVLGPFPRRAAEAVEDCDKEHWFSPVEIREGRPSDGDPLGLRTWLERWL